MSLNDLDSNGFYVTLTSNSSTNFFENNASSFTVHLSEEIRLSSHAWEVGLVDIIFPHIWENVGDDISNGITYKFNLNVDYIPEGFRASKQDWFNYLVKTSTDWHYAVDILVTLKGLQKPPPPPPPPPPSPVARIVVTNYNDKHEITRKPVTPVPIPPVIALKNKKQQCSIQITRHQLKIPKGNYETVDIIVDTINKCIKHDMYDIIATLDSEITGLDYKKKYVAESKTFFKDMLMFGYNDKLRRIFVESVTGQASVIFDTDLTTMLGFSVYDMSSVEDGFETSSAWKCRASYPPNLHETSAYLYTDINKHQFVGDGKAELLQIIPINRSATNNFIHFLYIRPQYVPVSRERFHTIAVDLRTHYGTLFNFPAGSTSLKLHFRPMRNNWF